MALYSADFWKKHLQLHDHIEGGGYHEMYRSSLLFSRDQLPPSYSSSRSACTHIYFLLEKGQFSAFHKIVQDELWHFYDGHPLVVYEIDETGLLREHLLGNDPTQGQSHFCVVKGGNWFGSRPSAKSAYSLVGCTVAPGFDFADFEMATRDALLAQFPQYAHIIEQLTRK